MSSENLSVSDAGPLFPRDDLFENVPMNSPSISHFLIHNNSLFENIFIEPLIPQNEIHTESSFENVSIEPDFVNLDPTCKLSPTAATPLVSYTHTIVMYSNLQRSLTFESEHGGRYEPFAYRSDSQSNVIFPKNESSGSWHQETVSVSLEATFTSNGPSYSVRDGTKIGDPTVLFEQAKFPTNPSVHPHETLRLVKYVVGKSGVELRREMQRHSVAIRQLLHYKGQSDTLKGDALNKAVRDTANEAIFAMFSKEHDNEDGMDLDSQTLDPFISIIDNIQIVDNEISLIKGKNKNISSVLSKSKVIHLSIEQTSATAPLRKPSDPCFQLLHRASLTDVLKCLYRHFKNCSGSLPFSSNTDRFNILGYMGAKSGGIQQAATCNSKANCFY